VLPGCLQGLSVTFRQGSSALSIGFPGQYTAKTADEERLSMKHWLIMAFLLIISGLFFLISKWIHVFDQ